MRIRHAVTRSVTTTPAGAEQRRKRSAGDGTPLAGGAATGGAGVVGTGSVTVCAKDEPGKHRQPAIITIAAFITVRFILLLVQYCHLAAERV